MKLYERTAATYSIDARGINGQKIDVLTLEGATYALSNGYDKTVKTLADGLRIESEQLFVDLTADDLTFSGRAKQELIYSTDGVNYQGASIRQQFIDIIGRN